MQRLSRRLTAPRPASRPPAKLERIAPRALRGDSSDRSPYRTFDGHPVNYSPPWMEGTRSVGSTLNLHVGGWWNAETYWIYLWQWTPAYGWQEVGWYDLGYATSMQLYLGWEWANTYIGFEVMAWNSNPWHGWSDRAWSGGEYVYPYWGRPWNMSGPWVEGHPAVGNTVQLHVGSWAEAEQYAIDLYRYTHAAGWTYIGNYQLGGATSMSLYLGTDWADAYIGYYAYAWNPPHGWSDAAWSGMHWVDPRRPANVSAPYVSGTPRVGNTVSLNVGQWRHTEQYAIDLYRYTASAGWTFIGNYYLGGASSMSLYLGTDWADAHIGFYAWGWNGIWGWSTNAWSGSYWVDPVRPTNLSAPYVAGTREVGSTVSLHVGQWRDTEQYAIDLYRYTASAGWTFIGNYYLGGATSMSLYLGWEWADAQIGFYAWGWNGIWGWSTNAWSGSHYVDPLSVAVSLGPLSVTTYDPAVTSSSTDWGANVTTSISDSSARETYRWRFQLAANQRLESLSGGGVAVVKESDSEPDVDPEEDYSDAEPVDPEELEEEVVGEEDPLAPDEELLEFDDEPFLDDNLSDDESDPEVGADRELALIGAAQDEVDGYVAAVVGAPSASDANGNPVPVGLGVSGNVVTLTVSHRSGAYSYPVTAVAELVEEAEEPNDAEGASGSAAGRSAVAEAAADCTVRAEIVTYNPSGWGALFQAFRANPTPCADYYIVIPPPSLARTEPKDKQLAKKRTVRRCTSDSPEGECNRIVDRICSADSANGARFHPVAEFHRGAWEAWVDSVAPEQGPARRRAWHQAGRTFRIRMANAGYGTRCQGSGRIVWPRWAINELPSKLRSSADVRANTMAMSRGLFHGDSGYRKSRGIPFLIDAAHHRANFVAYKANLRELTTASRFWNAMKGYTLLWGQETYTNCWKTCLARYGRAGQPPYSAATRSKYVNAFVMHPVRFAYAGRSATTAARSFYVPRYFPLLTAYWQSQVYGRTDGLTLAQMKGHASLQIYSVRRWATTPGRRYPGLRIGFAWANSAGDDLAAHIAAAVKAAYSPGGAAVGACTVGGGNWCTVSVPDRRFGADSCPEAKRTVFKGCWERNFTDWSKAVRNCPRPEPPTLPAC